MGWMMAADLFALTDFALTSWYLPTDHGRTIYNNRKDSKMKFIDGLKDLFGKKQTKATSSRVAHFEKEPMPDRKTVVPDVRFATATKVLRRPANVRKAWKNQRRMHKVAACRPTY